MLFSAILPLFIDYDTLRYFVLYFWYLAASSIHWGATAKYLVMSALYTATEANLWSVVRLMIIPNILVIAPAFFATTRELTQFDVVNAFLFCLHSFFVAAQAEITHEIVEMYLWWIIAWSLAPNGGVLSFWFENAVMAAANIFVLHRQGSFKAVLFRMAAMVGMNLDAQLDLNLKNVPQFEALYVLASVVAWTKTWKAWPTVRHPWIRYLRARATEYRLRRSGL